MPEIATKPKCYSYIRFSTPEQLKGNSLERQIALSKRYAEENGLVLDESLKLRDLGLSAYSGANTAEGALGRFLELIKAGKIPKGSTLIVESLDRLSRKQAIEALSQFIKIVENDISIVTLADNMKYSKDTMNDQQLLLSIVIMSRAHEESHMKSLRSKAVWESKRANIKSRKMTSRGPSWLKLNKKNQKFVRIPDRCRIIERIYRMYLDGHSIRKIATALNGDGLPDFNKGNGWYPSYIKKILCNSAVIGEYQPHKMENKKRVPVGDAVKDYFPRVISDEDFYRVQERINLNIGKGGRTGKVNNLFSHIAKCGYCGGSMNYEDKGENYLKLICNKANRGVGCIKTRYNYREFEKAFLDFCSELDVSTLLPSNGNDIKERMAKVKQSIEGLNGKLNEKKKQLANYDKLLATDDSEDFLSHIRENMKAALKEKNDIEEGKRKLERNYELLSQTEQSAEAKLQSIKELQVLLASKKGDELIALRNRLRMELRQLVERIEVFPLGPRDRIRSLEDLEVKYVSCFKRMNDPYYAQYDPDLHEDEESFKRQKQRVWKEIQKHVDDNTGTDKRFFAVWFKAGGFKEVRFVNGRYEAKVDTKSYEDLWKQLMKNVGTDEGDTSTGDIDDMEIQGSFRPENER